MPEQWNPNTNKLIRFNNGESDGIITLPKIFKSIIDTSEFQRLRNIHQLGVSHFVFPGADHSRFVHSLGTASLAYKFMNKLAMRTYDDDETLVTGNDILAVSLAALCHDLGHGPFSHTYEEVFNSENHVRHETLSIRILNKIFHDYPYIKEEFDEFFDESYYKFVGQLIDPPNFCNVDGEWPLVVDKKKVFLFAIVSNSINGLDVDKMDYLLRDSQRAGISVGINKNMIELLFETAEIVQHPEHDFNWIAFPDRYKRSIENIFEARKTLHEELYNHRVVIALEEYVKKALQCAADDLKILGKNNNDPIELKNCSHDLDAFVKLNDSVVDLIKNSLVVGSKMNEAKMILKQIEERKFPCPIAKIDNLGEQGTEFVTEVRNVILEMGNIVDADLITVLKVFHFGKGRHNPVGDVLFKVKNSNELVQRCGDTSCFRTCLFVFGPVGFSHSKADHIFEQLVTFAKEKTFEIPSKLYT